MSEKSVLILQSNVMLKNYELNELYYTILAQKERGVILLPSYVKVVNIPEDVINGELVIMNSGAPEPKEYVIKSPGGMYLESWNKCESVVNFTDYKHYAQKFDKESAEYLITKILGSTYTMEEL